MPTALEILYCTRADVEAILSQEGVELRLDDDGSGQVASTELARLTTQGINYASSRVNFYCLAKYEASELAKSWLVNEWATIIAARWLCSRRGNSPPESLENLYEQVLEDLKGIRSDEAQIPDIGPRDAAWPAWSNISFDTRYQLRRLRVERPISEQTTPNYPQHRDVAADLSVEPN